MAKQGLLYGSGLISMSIITATGITRSIFPQLLDFSIEGESGEVVAKGLKRGVEIVTGSAQNTESYKAKIGCEDVGWTELQLALGRNTSASTNIVIVDVREGKINAAGEISDLDVKLVASPAFAAAVTATIVADDLPLAEVTTAPTVTQFKADRVANKLIFNTGHAGKTVTYTVTTQVPTADTIGLEANPDRLNLISFNGLCYGSGGTVHSRISIPRMSKISAPSLSLGTDATKLELEYRLISTSASELPFYLQKLHT